MKLTVQEKNDMQKRKGRPPKIKGAQKEITRKEKSSSTPISRAPEAVQRWAKKNNQDYIIE